MTNAEQLTKVAAGSGFCAALDQSGGSTPQALRLYGIGEQSYRDEREMFDLVHRMRTRIITSPSFDGDRILGTILFEQTMDRSIDGLPSAEYFWQRKRIVPFLKTDQGLAPAVDGVRCMKPVRGLAELLERSAAARSSAPRCARSCSWPTGEASRRCWTSSSSTRIRCWPPG